MTRRDTPAVHGGNRHRVRRADTVPTRAAERLWVNPDCGLKTRAWPEVRAALENLVTAAREVRGDLAPTVS
ncbi:hypothetical protein OHB41_03205 [Streptomyces sp. NBC_01571]|uniref:hypothetical protein n=1 Tax=Streptomyces sp. NBC_01571 TaxID=2975883 RepID=UPI00224D75EE|nr:hypothetical protein [Streptomyces sp. NBC_01571]MCX4572207.1 hypothetical protein [Streptomyces sp. NBC_01571]